MFRGITLSRRTEGWESLIMRGHRFLIFTTKSTETRKRMGQRTQDLLFPRCCPHFTGIRSRRSLIRPEHCTSSISESWVCQHCTDVALGLVLWHWDTTFSVYRGLSITKDRKHYKIQFSVSALFPHLPAIKWECVDQLPLTNLARVGVRWTQPFSIRAQVIINALK